MVRAIELTGIDYYHSREDVETLKRLVAMLPENPVIVNIGTAFGTSVLAMLEAREDCYIFAIDIDPAIEAPANIADQSRVAFIFGKSQEVGRHWPLPADMVFVDGAHYRDMIIGDIQVWLPNIKPGGIVAFDDYGKPICPAVKPVVDEFMAGYEQILLVDDIIAFWMPR